LGSSTLNLKSKKRSIHCPGFKMNYLESSLEKLSDLKQRIELEIG